MKVKERKFIVVGDRSCGKTAIIRATSCEMNDSKHPTVYYKFFTRLSRKKKKKNGELKTKSVHISFWDIPGDDSNEEGLDEARRAIYNKMDAVLLVYAVDRRDTLEHARWRWYPEVRQYCHRKIPIILVGNKVDLRDYDDVNKPMVRYEDGLRVAEKIKAYAYVECSAFNNEQILEVWKFALKSVFKHYKYIVL